MAELIRKELTKHKTRVETQIEKLKAADRKKTTIANIYKKCATLISNG